MELHPSLLENVHLLGEQLGQLTLVRLQSAIESISEIKQVTELLGVNQQLPALSQSAIHT